MDVTRPTIFDWICRAGGGDFDIFADHTYVKSSSGKSWNCWGRSDGGHEICRGIGSVSVADRIAQPQPGSPLDGECAGLTVYAVDGVCHQAANRILWPARDIVNHAHGYWLSVSMYGTYGGSAEELDQKKSPCIRYRRKIYD